MVYVYAQIKNRIVVNTITLEENEDTAPHEVGFSFFKRIDNVVDDQGYKKAVGRDWLYDDPDTWTPPTTLAPNYQLIAEDKVQKAMDGFEKLLKSYAAANMLAGITQLGKTKLIADTFADVMRYGQSGSLYQAISALQAIVITNEMAPFLTADKVNSMVQDTLNLIASL